MNATDFDTKLGCFNGPTAQVGIGDTQLAAHESHWPAEPGSDQLTVVSVGVGLDVVDLTPAEAAALAPKLHAFADQLAAIAAQAQARTAATALSQQIVDRAEQGGFPMRTLLQVAEALHGPNPIATIEWLLAVETDETARSGFQAALDTLGARRGGDQ